ncbi:MAG: helix-turn-helix domain-containing protein [Bacteroidota bacterium]
MGSIIISGIALSLLLLSLMLSKKKKLRADKFLIGYLFYFAVSQTWFYLETFDAIQQSPWMLMGRGLYLLHAPMFFFYVCALIQKKLSLRHYSAMLAPFTIYLAIFLYYNQWGFDNHQISVANGLLYEDGKLSAMWTFLAGMLLASDPVYLVLYYVLLKNYRKKVLESVSYTDQIHLKWLNLLFYVWVVSAVILIPLSMLSIGRDWIPMTVLQTCVQIANVIFIFILGYYGFRQTTIFSNLDLKFDAAAPPGRSNGYERSGLSQQQAGLLHSQLLILMKEKKPYLNGELNAGELSEQLGISVNYLSQILNQQQQQNFFDFINSYRVNEVKEKMKDPQYRNFTLLAIALESGFNSKTSFNTIFKKFTQQTPSEYYKSAVKN